MKYVLMFAGSTGDQEAWDKMTEEQKSTAYGHVMKWWEEHSAAGRIVGVADVFDDAVPRVFVITEEQGRNGYGHTLYLDETEARRLRTALATALREFGADPGA